MARPIKWSRDLYPIRDRAANSRTETWSRQDIERLFDIGRVAAQGLMKAIGEVQAVGGAHFVERTSLLEFLEDMIAADSVEAALRRRQDTATPVPRPKPLRVSIPHDLRQITVADLPANVELLQGQIRVSGADAEQVIEGLFLLAQVLQNDLDNARALLDPPAPSTEMDQGLQELLRSLRQDSKIAN